MGRLGLLIHSTAGYVDPGWKGTLTLELSNVANLPIALYFGMRIGQISFFRMTSPVERPYGTKELGSKYQGQSEPTASAFHADFDRGRRRRAPAGGRSRDCIDAVRLADRPWRRDPRRTHPGRARSGPSRRHLRARPVDPVARLGEGELDDNRGCSRR